MTTAVARRLCFKLFSRIRDERIEVVEDGRRFAFGPDDAELRAEIRVHRPGAWPALLRGSTGLAESYMDGDWDTDDLVRLIRIAARQMGGLDRARRSWRSVLSPAQRLGRMVPENDLLGARRNISAHYDLGNDLFSLFLDPSMMYSCAFFETPEMTLAEAQEAKLERICKALALMPGDHLLEIGTGWGALAVHAAGRYGCRVTTTTISKEQHDLATDRVRAAGLEDRVEILLEDYRDLTGRYDKLVSIEMIEAVGWQYFPEYFRRCSELLTPEGLMLLQAITVDDRAYEGEKSSRSFINKYIFPGGCLPSLEVIGREIARETDMQTIWLDDITAHYAETLVHWREGFLASEDRAAAMGYDLRFRRMWELYLCYVEAGFRERRIGDVQIVFAKPQWRGGLGWNAAGADSVPRLAAERPRGDLVEQERRAAAG
jgi:cyclopropane-fatty-acyl-phospholipid synthase